jgi:hypothetical protein
MISEQELKQLVSEKLTDTEALISKRRYNAAIYIVGYELEIVLKLKICKILKFDKGFPENKNEFKAYLIKSNKNEDLIKSISNIQEIRNHNLGKLMFYSGVEIKIKRDLLDEWSKVASWNPEMRYKLLTTTKEDAIEKANATQKIINEIL